MGEQAGPSLPRIDLVHCTACGYDISSVSLGGACPECGAPVSGFEAEEARGHHLHGLTIVLWALPAILAACLSGPLMFWLTKPAEGFADTSRVSHLMALFAAVPATLTLVGIWLAVGTGYGCPVARWLRRVVLIMFVLIATMTAHRLVAHGAVPRPIGAQVVGPNVTWVFGHLRVSWLGTYGLSAIALVSPVVAVLWGLWLETSLIRVGLKRRRTTLAAGAMWLAAPLVVAFWLAPAVRWWGERTLAAVPAQSVGRPGITTKGAPPWHALWINSDSATFIATVGYALIILLGVWFWLATLRLRERTRWLSTSSRVGSLTSAS